MEKRVISTQLQEEDYKIESSLRPQRLEDSDRKRLKII